MFSIGNYIYHVNSTTKTIIKRNLKFGTTSKFYYERLFVSDNYYYVEYDKCRTINTILNGKDYSKQLFEDINPATVLICDKFLMYRRYAYHELKYFVEDQINIIVLKNPYLQILNNFKNNSIAVVYGATVHDMFRNNKSYPVLRSPYTTISIYNTFEKFITNGETKCELVSSKCYFYNINDNIIEVQCCKDLVINFKFYNLELKLTSVVDDFEHKFTINNLTVRNNTMYAWNDSHIMIYVDHVVWIKNSVDVQIYNNYYNIFMNNMQQMFRIVDYKIVQFHFKYDMWRDVDQPVFITNCVTMLIEMDLFPPEISNIIYEQLARKIQKN